MINTFIVDGCFPWKYGPVDSLYVGGRASAGVKANVTDQVTNMAADAKTG